MSDHAALQRKIAALEEQVGALAGRIYQLRDAIEALVPDCDGTLDCKHCAAMSVLEDIP